MSMDNATLPAPPSAVACADPVATNYTYSQHVYDELAFYYDYTARVMRFVISTVNDATILRVAAMIKDPRETSIFIMEDVFRNGYILFVVIASLCISFILLVSCILAAICGAFTRGKRMPSKRTITCAMISFLFCLTMATMGTILFSRSVVHIKHGLVILPAQLNKSSEDISTFVAGFGENLRCNFDEGEKLLRHEIDMFIIGTTDVLSKLRKRINPLPMIKALEIEERCRLNLNNMSILLKESTASSPELKVLIQATDNMLKVLDTSMYSMRDSLHDTRDSLMLLGKDLNTSIAQMNGQKSAILSELSGYRKVLENLVKAVDEQSEEFRAILYHVVRQNDYAEQTSKYISVVLILPLILVTLSAVGLIFLFFRFVGNIGSKEAEEEFPIRNMVSHMGAKILGLGGYVALFVTSLLFLMVALCFVIAFASMFLCMGLFEDHELRLLHALPQRTFKSSLGKDSINFNLFDTFYKCRNGFSFFDAIEGDKIWARKQVGKKLSELRKSSFRRRLRNFYVDENVIGNVNKTVIQIREMSKNFNKALNVLPTLQNTNFSGISADDVGYLGQEILNDTADLNAALVESIDMLVDLTSRSRRDKFSMDIQTHLKQVDDAMVNAVAKLLSAMQDLTPQCQSLMAIWDDIGFYLCNIIAVPTQGLWVACLLTAIGAFSIYSALFEATTFLFNYAEEKAESLRQKATERALVYSLEKTQTDREKSVKAKGQKMVLPGIDTQSSDAVTSTTSIQRRPGRIEWVLVDDILQQLFGIPSGVKFMPVLVSEDLEKGGQKMKPLRRKSMERLAWTPSGTAIAPGSWQVIRSDAAEKLPPPTTKDLEREEVRVEIPDSRGIIREAGEGASKPDLSHPESERLGENEPQEQQTREKTKKSPRISQKLEKAKKSPRISPKHEREKKSPRISPKLEREKKSPRISPKLEKAKKSPRISPKLEKTAASEEKPTRMSPTSTSQRRKKIKQEDHSPRVQRATAKDVPSEVPSKVPDKEEVASPAVPDEQALEAVPSEDMLNLIDKAKGPSPPMPSESKHQQTKATRSPSASVRQAKELKHSAERTKEDTSSKKHKNKSEGKATSGAPSGDVKKGAEKDKDPSPPSTSEPLQPKPYHTAPAQDESLKSKKAPESKKSSDKKFT